VGLSLAGTLRGPGYNQEQMVRAVAQRARSGAVTIGSREVARIGRGLVILVGIRDGDDERAVEKIADKIAVMRVFEDEQGKMNRSAADIRGAMLVVSQFTLYGDLRKGRRPSFVDAASPEIGKRLYEQFAARLASHGYEVQCGEFGAHMMVSIENDGPVTIILDSDAL
jgi:D-aminoacyl-tRNA deacylase